MTFNFLVWTLLLLSFVFPKKKRNKKIEVHQHLTLRRDYIPKRTRRKLKRSNANEDIFSIADNLKSEYRFKDYEMLTIENKLFSLNSNL